MTSRADKSSPAVRPGRLVAALVFAALTVSVMSTLGTPLIPTIAAAQHVSLETAQWLLTVTLLVGVVATPVLGRLGDGARRDRVLVGTLACTLVGSVVAATAHRFPQLLAGRALQGIGYGTVPLAIALAREHLTGARRRSAIATLSITVAVGAGLGFPVTGLIAQDLDYHAAFWFAAIFGAAALAAVLAVVPRTARGDARVRMDVPGAVLLGAGLGALLLALSKAETWGWGSAPVLGLGCAGVAALAAWVTVELRVSDPLVDLRLARRRAVLGANVAGLLMGMGMYVGMALVNRLVQTPESTGYGFSASLVTTGLLLLPLSAGSLVSQPVARAMTERFGIRAVLPVGAAIVALTLIALGATHAHLWEIAVVTALLGAGIGGTFAAMPALIVANVPADRTGSAMSLNQVLRSAGGSLGSAVGITILTAHTAAGAAFPADRGYTVAFVLGGVLCLLAAAATLWLVPSPAPAPPEPRPLEFEVRLLMGESAVAGAGPDVFDGERAERA
jgi:MFS family permease